MTADAIGLRYRLAPRASLTPAETRHLYALFHEGYRDISPEEFLADLSWKDHVGLLEDEHGTAWGFTTFALEPRGCRDVLFSGDTYVAREHWGSQALVRGVAHTWGRLLAGRPGRRLWWFLISKGHRTYVYLPLFFHRYAPAQDHRDAEVSARIDECATTLYGDAWDPRAGVIRALPGHGALRPELAAATFERPGNRHVEYFLARNPGFVRGDELACMAEISPDNMRGLARAQLLEGMREPLAW